MTSSTIRENIRIFRDIKYSSQEYMAMKLNISQPAYANIESGKSSLTIKKLQDISAILDIELKDIVNTDSKNFYTFNNNQVANVSHFIENFYTDTKDVYEKLIKKQEEEIAFLRSMVNNKG